MQYDLPSYLSLTNNRLLRYLLRILVFIFDATVRELFLAAFEGIGFFPGNIVERMVLPSADMFILILEA